MIMTADPVPLTPDSPQHPLVFSCGPWAWDVRVAGHIVTIQGVGTHEDILNFAVEQIQLWSARKVLES